MAKATPEQIADAVTASMKKNLIEAGAEDVYNSTTLGAILRLVRIAAEKAVLIDRMQMEMVKGSVIRPEVGAKQ